MKSNKLVLIFNTVKYLKFTQIYYRLFYYIRNKFRIISMFKYDFSKKSVVNSLNLIDSCECNSLYNNGKFNFLNLPKKFDSDINWNYSEFGKLWTYNLVYFDYLNEKDDVTLIYDFIDEISNIKDGLEPFPISLRGINWIKFLIKHKIEDNKINDSLYAQYYILLDNLEYHLLGNHLLENGFSLLFGAYYFQDNVLYKKAKKILIAELDEQILEDGGHFELSPMYHQIMLFRVLDCINLVQNNSWKNKELLNLLDEKASIMLGWLEQITYENGDIPLLNDSANKISPTTKDLTIYSSKLKINANYKPLNKCGYIKINKKNYELIVDIGHIGPDYIPGHAHADTFNFELQIKNKPFIVDTGLSTYNTGRLRDSQRSTKAHNTVEINGANSSEIWGGFRVAKRANIINLKKNTNILEATHDGYKDKFGILHTRNWEFQNNNVIISDSLDKNCEAIAYLHFHPDITEKEILDKIKIKNSDFKIQKYNYAPEFNKIIEALVLEISFKKELKVEIKI